jgi:hypothetical protein
VFGVSLAGRAGAAGSCPNGGKVDHVECLYGIFSNHSLDDPTVYPDDVVLHTSDQDCFPYYRPMASLEDTPAMEGNCKIARPGFGESNDRLIEAPCSPLASDCQQC